MVQTPQAPHALGAPAPDDTLDDAALMTQVAAGDAGAFEALMRRHNRRMYRTARGILRNDHDAEDALQDAYLSAYRAAGSFRQDAKVSTWLQRIVINASLQRVRRQRGAGAVLPMDATMRTHQEEAVDRVETDTPEAASERAQMRRLIEGKIDALPDAFRVVFILRVLEEMTVEETATALAIPESTVRTRHFRARGLLREGLAQDVDTALEGAFAFAGERCNRVVSRVLAALTPFRS